MSLPRLPARKKTLQLREEKGEVGVRGRGRRHTPGRVLNTDDHDTPHALLPLDESASPRGERVAECPAAASFQPRRIHTARDKLHDSLQYPRRNHIPPLECPDARYVPGRSGRGGRPGLWMYPVLSSRGLGDVLDLVRPSHDAITTLILSD